jgi:hypothetical protein
MPALDGMLLRILPGDLPDFTRSKRNRQPSIPREGWLGGGIEENTLVLSR